MCKVISKLALVLGCLVAPSIAIGGQFVTNAAIGDVNGDGTLDIVFSVAVGQNLVLLNHHENGLENISTSALPKTDDLTMGVALGDIDSDGDLDLICGSLDKHNRIYINDGKGRFSDETSKRLEQAKPMNTHAVHLFDADLDRDLDIVFGNLEGRSRLYLNDGKGFYKDATEDRFPENTDWSLSIVHGDLNGDKCPDLVLGRNKELVFCLNDCKGRFTAVARVSGGGSQLALGDIDRDGDLDLVAANILGSARLFLNDGKGQFLEVAPDGLPRFFAMKWSSVSLGDVDADGDLDLVAASKDDGLRLAVNDGAGKLQDVTDDLLAVGKRVNSILVERIMLFDGDGDKDLDLLIVGGDGSIFENDGKGRYR